MDYILGIDVGTSNVKAVLFDGAGNEAFTAAEESETIRRGNTVEQDMHAVWGRVRRCVNAVAEALGENRILAIGITGQGEGCWLIDEQGEPVQNAILWCDGRATAEVRAITDDAPEIGREYHRTTGNPPLTGSSMMLLKWMQNNRKDVLDRASYAFNCKDWVRYKMTGVVTGELTDSFMSMIDQRTNTVAKELMTLLGMGEYVDYVPEPRRSGEIVGTLLDSLADEWGLRRGIPVIAGAVDTSATAVGLGAIHKNDVCVILGTTCACEIVFEKESCHFGAEGTRYEKHPLPGLYVELQPTMNGTPNIEWMIGNISTTGVYNEIDRIIDSVPVGSGGVLYHPYIGASGERAPFYHPYASAGFFGLSQATGREHLIRAVYEGISLSIRDCLGSADKSGTIYLAGGGAKSPVWAQMIADVVGMRVVVSGGKEFGAKGVAMLAGMALGLYQSCEEAVEKACTFEKIYDPDPVRAKQYDLLYGLYRSIREQNTGLWNERHEVMAAMAGLEKNLA